MAGYKRLDAVVDTIGEENQTVNVSGNSVTRKIEEIRRQTFSFREFYKNQQLSQGATRFGESIIGGVGSDEIAMAVKQSPDVCLELFVSLLRNFNSKPKLQFILTLLADVTENDESTVTLAMKDEELKLLRLLVSLLGRQDNYSQATACLCFSRLAALTPATVDTDQISQYLQWTLPQLKQNNDYLCLITKAVLTFLRKCEHRLPFYDNNGLKPLLDLLDRKLTFQFQYELIFSIWLLSFESELVNNMKEFPVAVVLCDVLKNTNKPKVRRIILATFKNLIQKADDAVAEKYSAEMIHFKTIPVLRVLDSSALDDEDFEQDVTFLLEKLEMSLQDLSSFDEYATEVTSGRLEWSPVHKSDKFWRENVMKLNDNQYNLLRLLVAVLRESQSPTAIAVAAHDLGEYVRYYPKGKNVIDRMGAKETVMHLVNHENTEVRMQALLSIQKMMVQNWEYLGKQLESKA